MSDETTKQEPIATRTEVVRITATEKLWDSFMEWTQQQSCTSTAEGFRIAMRTVTTSATKYQEEN